MNEALLHNMKGVNPHGQPTHSANISKEEYHHKIRTNSAKEEKKEEHTPDFPKNEHHNSSSEGSLSPCRKRQKNDGNLKGDSLKIKSQTYEGEMNTEEKDEEWILSMRK